MALGLLWLGLALLIQARGSTPELLPAPALRDVPPQRDFQNKEFQGKWYVLGLAGNEINKEKHRQFKVYTTTYELTDYWNYNVTSTVAWNLTCTTWFRTFDLTLWEGLYSLGNIEEYPEIYSYHFQVSNTDYKQFAIVFFKEISNSKAYFTNVLYGRTMVLTPEMKESFIRFSKSMGLTDQHIIFAIPLDECTDM